MSNALAAAFAFAALVVLLAGGPAARAADPPRPYRRGVNVAGLEFAHSTNEDPGRHGTRYWGNSERTYEYFARKGLDLFRVPFLWERLQPRLSGPLDEDYLKLIKNNADWAAKHGGQVVLDLHNYARYSMVIDGKPTSCVIGATVAGKVRVRVEDFCDVWVRLSNEFKGHPGVYAYGLMNEPHDMGESSWKTISQAALDAIRKNGDRTLVLVCGDCWGNAQGWEQKNGGPWIHDPANNFAYEAHSYWDHNTSGAYQKSYDEELARDPQLRERGARHLADFVGWCRKHGVRGFLGEYGVPPDPRWLEVLDRFLAALDEAGMDGTYWAAGEWWWGYFMSVQPDENYTKDKPQLAVLLKHLPNRASAR